MLKRTTPLLFFPPYSSPFAWFFAIISTSVPYFPSRLAPAPVGAADHPLCGKNPVIAQWGRAAWGVGAEKPNNLERAQEPFMTGDVLNKHSGYRHVSQPPSFPPSLRGWQTDGQPEAASEHLPKHERAGASENISQINTLINGCGVQQQRVGGWFFFFLSLCCVFAVTPQPLRVVHAAQWMLIRFFLLRVTAHTSQHRVRKM